ncbi:MAG: hypothetical protein WC661_20600 [Opitutaceae bacterium]|jgi:hypothetical protein
MKKYTCTLGLAALLSSSAFAATHNVTADITTDTTWIATDTYVLDKVIYVKGCTLDIPAGTIVRGQPDETSLVGGSIVVRPDAKIKIRGTNTNPVIFTTAALDTDLDGKVNKVGGKFVRWTAGNDAQFFDLNPKTAPLAPTCVSDNESDVDTTIRTMQMWGGIVIAGDAFTNNANQVESTGDVPDSITTADLGQGIIEGLTGADAIYGGTNEQHNGGSIKYVSIRHGGLGLSDGKEINALTLYAVGKDTTIENIDIYCTSDDGIEIFGGDVNIKYANINYADDDGFDVDEGWRGSAQFVFVLQGNVGGLDIGDNGLEIDGEDKVESQAGVIDPLPFGKMYNFTVWAYGDNDSKGSATTGIRMRAGFAGILANSIVQNISGTVQGNGIRVDGLVTTATTGTETVPSARTNFGTGLLQVRNNAVYGFTSNYSSFTDVLAMTSAGAVSGTIFGSVIPNVYYPATNNRSDLSTMFTVASISHTAANGINPRPLTSASTLAYGSTQDGAYVPTPLVAPAYKGAFDRDATTIWTSGWTALNKRGILKN